MKAMLALMGVLVMSSTVFAGTTDLKTMNDLISVGLSEEGGMSKIQVGIRNPDCGESMQTGKVDCTGIDMGANGGEGAPFTLEGAKAATLMGVIFRMGGTGDEGMGKSYMSAGMITCQQSNEKVAGGSAASRTTCTIETEQQ